jgi:hypothetical protein
LLLLLLSQLGLHSRYDEWLQYEVDRHRYAVIYSHTERPKTYGYVVPRVGVPLDMLDTTDHWLHAQVVAVNMVRVSTLDSNQVTLIDSLID